MKALALVEGPNHVCGRYRVRAFEPALNRQGGTLVTLPIARNTLVRLYQFARLPRFDTILIQRKLLPAAQLKMLRRVAGRLVFDFDDAVFHRDSYDGRGQLSTKRSQRFRATIGIADTIIAGNDFLADAALKAGARADQVVVIPTCVDTSLYPQDVRTQPRAGGLELVWIGSSSTLRGLEARRDLFDRLAEEIPGIKLRVICDRFPMLGSLPIVEVPWNEATEASQLAEGDVGISWIPDDLWSRGKCGLKVLQYQAAGLPVLANPIGVHPEMIQPGENGWLPDTDDEWIESVKQLAADPIRRLEMGRNARLGVEAGYSVDAWSETFVATLAGPLPNEPRRAIRAEVRSDRSGAALGRTSKINRPLSSPPIHETRRGEIGVNG